MAEYQTNDIWNDNDGDDGEERQQKPRRHPVRRFLLFFAILLAVLAVVAVAAWRDGTGFDALVRRFAYGSAQGESAADYFSYDAAANNRFAAVGDGLAVLSGTELRVMDGQGRQVCSVAVNFENPALTAVGDRAVAYDVGGTALYVVDEKGNLLLHLTADSAETFLSASLNEKGWLAVTAEMKGYKGAVSVYDEKLTTPVFVFRSSRRFVTGGCVTADCKTLAAVTLGQSGGTFVSDVVLYDLNLDAQDPQADYNVENGLVLELCQKGSALVSVSDTGLTFADLSGGISAAYGFGGWYLRDYDLAGDGYSVALLGRYQSGNVGKLVTVGDDGEELAALDVRESILSVSAAGRYIAVLYTDKLVIYNQELQEYASLTGTDYAKSALVRSDGSALLLASDSARLFLP
jgi:nitrogen fixation protein FixH